MKKIIVGITGASGSIYAIKLIHSLLKKGNYVYIVLSNDGLNVLEFETKQTLQQHLQQFSLISNNFELCDNNNMFSGIASGSFIVDAMIIVPCSMNTVSLVCNSITPNLLTRAADVTIKQNRPLVIVPRETPLSVTHLENLTKLAKLGATIVPAMPAHYNFPNTIDDMNDFIVGKILDSLHMINNEYSRWQ